MEALFHSTGKELLDGVGKAGGRAQLCHRPAVALPLLLPLPSLILSALTASSLGAGRAPNVCLQRTWCKQDSAPEDFKPFYIPSQVIFKSKLSKLGARAVTFWLPGNFLPSHSSRPGGRVPPALAIRCPLRTRVVLHFASLLVGGEHNENTQ